MLNYQRVTRILSVIYHLGYPWNPHRIDSVGSCQDCGTNWIWHFWKERAGSWMVFTSLGLLCMAWWWSLYIYAYTYIYIYHFSWSLSLLFLIATHQSFMISIVDIFWYILCLAFIDRYIYIYIFIVCYSILIMYDSTYKIQNNCQFR